MPGDVTAPRGRTITSPIRSHTASDDKKSRLYCAMPPCPPNASVTSARTRSEDSAIIFPLRPPPPGTPSAAPRDISEPQAQEPGATAGCAYHAAASHWIGVVNPVFGRSITLDGRGRRGLVASRRLDLNPFVAVVRRQLAQQFHIDQRNPHFERMGHAGPIGVAQQLIAHVQRRTRARRLCRRRPSAWASALASMH